QSISRCRRCYRPGTRSRGGNTRSVRIARLRRLTTTTLAARAGRPRRRHHRRRPLRRRAQRRRAQRRRPRLRLLRRRLPRRRRRRPRHHRHHRLRLARSRNAAVLGAGVLTLAGVCLCIASAWPHDSPLVPRNGGLLEGDATWAWLYLAGEIAAFVAYVGALLLLRRAAVRLTVVAVLAAVIQLAPLGAPLLISSDAWTYWDYGRIALVHDANPYAQPPQDFPGVPAYPYMGGAFHGTTSVYGPLFTFASEPVVGAAGSSADAAAWLFKSLAALAMLGTVALTVLLARRRAYAAALVGWNPLLALHFAGGGHNDAWMALLVMSALALGAGGRGSGSPPACFFAPRPTSFPGTRSGPSPLPPPRTTRRRSGSRWRSRPTCSANESRFRTPSAAGRLRRRPRRRRAGSGDRDGAAGFFRVRLACRCGRRATAFARRR